MAQLHHLRPPPRRGRTGGVSCDLLAWLCFGAGGIAAFLSVYLPELRGLSTLIGLGVAVGGYLAFFDRCRG